MMEIIFENKDFIVINKPHGMPTQSDLSSDPDALTLTSAMLREKGEAPDLWLVHRLDRVVAGLVVFARNKNTASRLSLLVGGKGMEKEYFAVVSGNAPGGTLVNFLYKDSQKSKAFVVDSLRKGAKEAILEYIPIAVSETEKGNLTLIKVKLHTGRFHQIRAQLSFAGMPISGDGKYGSRDNKAKQPALFSARLAFSVNDKKYDVSAIPDLNNYPWSLFDKELYK